MSSLIDEPAPDASSPPQAQASFFRSATFTFGTNVTVAILSLVNVLIVARALGPSGRGDVAFLTTIAYLTSQICTLGIHQANANLAAKHHHLTGRLAVNSTVLSIGLGLVGIAAVALLVLIVPAAGGPTSSALRWMALAAVPMLVLQVNLQQLVIAHYGFATSNLAWLVGPIVNVGGNGLLHLLGKLTVGSAVLTWIIGQTLGMLILAQYVVRRSRGGRWDRGLAREQMSFGIKAHLPRLFTLSNYRMDQWLMGALTSSTQLGLYSVAVSWAEALFFLPTSLAMVQRPDLVRADKAQAAREGAAVVRVALALTVIAAAVMILIAPFLCATIFGEDFAGSTNQLRVLVLGAFGVVALKLLGNTLTAQGRPLRETVAVGAAFVLILVLDVVLIPPHGGMGAAVASAVGYTGGGLVIAFVAGRTLGIRPLDLVPRPSDVATFAGRLRAVVSRA